MEKMIGILLLGFFLALLLFLLIFFMGNGALNRYFESSMYRRNVSKETIAMFQEYVSRHPRMRPRRIPSAAGRLFGAGIR